MLGLAALLAQAVFACSSSGDPKREHHDFSDAQGRACRATLAKIGESPAVSESVSCDADAKQCAGETKPCFQLSIAGQDEAYAIHNCPACCLGTASSFVASECTGVVCSTDADCVFARAQCQEGACICPQGSCG